ncbi:MAG: hypothetical protein K6B52_07020 [Clostridiales bacterium]|nr:hypothetical protein [Clostridiales bacterium]
MLSLFGCGRNKHKLNFDGFGFESAKTLYAAGEKVTVYYPMVATDTDYHFTLSDDSITLSEDYDSKHGFVLTFVMPDSDISLKVTSRNSMTQSSQITFINEVEKADIWILPQTQENMKSSLWGSATIKNLLAGEQREIQTGNTAEEENFIIRIIDDQHAYYSANGVTLNDGCVIRFMTDDSRFDAVIEITDSQGNILYSRKAFTGVFGAE